MAYLTLVLQGREVGRFVLNPLRTTIGRAQDNDIVINNLALSRRHAEVLRRGLSFEIRDLESQNGVFVNRTRIKGTHELKDTDVVTLGTYEFIFTFDERVQDARSTPAASVPLSRHDSLEATHLSDKRPTTTGAEETADLEPDRQHEGLLVLRYNDLELQKFVLERDRCVIGRGADCDIQIAERRLSRRHCQIELEAGRFVVKDLGSQNGTYVNRSRIIGPYPLKDGDVLNFAEYAVQYIHDAARYGGPDRRPPPPGSTDTHIRPSADPEDPGAEVAPAPPVSMRPAAAPVPPKAKTKPKAKAKGKPKTKPKMVAHRDAPAPAAAQEPPSIRPRQRPDNMPPPSSGLRVEEVDIHDERGDVRPDPNLDAWYNLREEDDALHGEGLSDLLDRGHSSVSRVLSTMMVDKRELDRNLKLRAKARRFGLEVFGAKGNVLARCTLEHDVTVLGADSDSDIRIEGRFVAGRHSLLVRVFESLLLVRLGSSSAARVNGLPKLQAFLKDGDVIQIDETTIHIFEE
ncbi:MAG: FHA domain-containing protein [Deltaproteobacteria bacterium]|nr:FHA domain-containing protein [Deltaproteobacteria bacterium]